MAILKSTLVNGDLTVTGSLNVQGDLTYIGVENLRVKDKQIELNTDGKGAAILSGQDADQAGIVFKGTTKGNSAEASILYNYADDTLVVNKTIKGTVASANNAASANKVANKLTVNVTDETGSKKTVEFDGSEAKTVDVNLKVLQDQIDSMSGAAGSIATQINNAINELDVEDTAVVGQYVSSVSETDGKISVTRAALPDYTEVYDAKGAAAAVKTELIGNNTDDKDSDTIKGAKKYADSLAAGKADASHKHAIADVEGLRGELDGKAAVSHKHTIADVTNLQAALDAKQDDLNTNQLAAVNSGITSAKVSDYDAHVANNVIHVTADDKKKWNAAEQNAKDYADGLAVNYDAAGTAAGLNTAMDKRVKVLEAIDHAQLAADASADAVAKVVAGADSDFDTLKEVADWIKSDTTGAAKLQTDVAGLKTDVSTLQTDVSTLESASHTHDNKAELDLIAAGDKAKWDKHVANGDIHVTAEQKAAWTAKQDALANAATLSTITPMQVTNWDDAATKAHEHDNKTVLDGITAEDVKAWDSAVSAARVISVGGKSGALTLKGESAALGDVNLSISDTGEISAAIVPNSFDAKGAAGTAEDNAKAYADEKVTELKNTVNSLSNDVLKGVAAGDYVSVSTKSNNSQTISVTTRGVATASDSNNGLALAADVKEYVDGKNALQDAEIADIKNGKTLDGRYVNVSGDTMTGKLTMNAADIEMSNNGANGIVFGNMKIVWNSTDNAIEFVAK